MRSFVMNVKLASASPWPEIEAALALLAKYDGTWTTLKARHLYHDRREITLMGRK